MATPGTQWSFGGGATTTRDCSQGLCSIYCPQLCPFFFPAPPPPLFFSDDPSSSGRSLSPLVIALIGILASALLLATYYFLISRYCGGLDCLRRRLAHDGANEEGSGAALRGDAWQAPPPASTPGGGLEEWVIRAIAVYRYKRGEGLVEGTDCSVCLCEFRDGESLRLLPDCCHAFHVSCIDTWLKSHNNCPLCRTNIVYTFASPSPSPPPPPPPPPHPAAPPPRTPPLLETGRGVAAAEETERRRERDDRRGAEGGGISARKESSRSLSELGVSEGRIGAIELSEEGIRPIGHSSDAPSHRIQVSVADMLRISTEDNTSAARNGVAVEEVGSSREVWAEQHACKVGSGDYGVLHCVLNPVAVKRSFPCFAGQGRGNHGSVLPL